jgi:membrane peptidoglycan carboxypeptidase
MFAKKPSSSRMAGGLLAFVGMSAIAGLVVSAAVSPAIAVTSMAANSTLGLFEDLPDYLQINTLAEKTSLYAKHADGSEVLLASFYAQNRVQVPLDQISSFVKDGAVATEDPRFYEHGGIDIIGTGRAILSNAAGRSVQGGSSISQQYVKNILVQRAESLPDSVERDAAYAAATETSIPRKIKEMKLSIGIEQKYSKDEILNGYLNIASFGGRVYGIEAASEYYFGVKAKDLTLAQSASLVATLNNPNNLRIDMPDNISANQVRRDYVLGRMLTEGKITEAQRDAAVAEPVTPKITPADTGCQTAGGAAFFCDYVTWIIKNDPVFGATVDDRWNAFQRGGWKIVTTLDLDLQAAAEAALDERVPKVGEVGDIGASAVSVQVGTGRVLAMAQSKDYSNDPEVASQGSNYTSINFNTDNAYGGSNGFPVGSTYKLFTLAEWLQAGHGLNEAVDGRTRTWRMSEFTDSCNGVGGPDWKPTNYAGAGQTATVLRALINSWNTNFITMASKLDLCNIRKTAEAFQVHRADANPLTSNPSAVLGTNEIAPISMATAVAGMAHDGLTCSPIAIDSITDPSGKTLAPPPSTCTQSVTTPVARTMEYAMEQVPLGTASASRIGDGVHYVAKTGTSDNSEHNWMLGSTTKVSTAVWLGNITGHTSVASVYGGNYYTVAQRVWASMMALANSRYGGDAFGPPDSRLVEGKSVAVPEIRGLTPEQAKALLEGLGFSYEDGGDTDSDKPSGTVAKSDPESGANTSIGALVKVFTSNGSMTTGPVTTIGMTEAAARTALTGFTVVVKTVPAPTMPCPGSSTGPTSTPTGTPAPAPSTPQCPAPNPNQGKVLTQDVIGGTVKKNATVTLTIQG